jgi:hypothetical protein
MMNTRRAACVAGLMVTVAAAAPPPRGRQPVYPEFKSDGYTLVCRRLELESDIDLEQRGEREHSLELEGAVRPPASEDAVAVTSEVKVIEALDGEGTNLVKRDRRRSAVSDRYKKGTYGGVLDGEAKVAISKLELTANPYTIKTITGEVEVIVAEARENRRLPPLVTEEPQEVVPGLDVKIQSLRLAKDGTLRVVVHCSRASDGKTGPVIEQVWALDENGLKISGGRWSEGDMFCKTGTLTANLQLSPKKTHKYLRFIAVTRYRAKVLRFQIKGIFQK